MNGNGFLSDLRDSVFVLLSPSRGTMTVVDTGLVGSGSNVVGKSRFRSSAKFSIHVGMRGFDETSPSSCFELAQAAFHEARHVMHHIDRMQNRNDAMSDTFTFAYLSREQNAVRYGVGYPNNAFELDANAYSVVKAKMFCEQFFPDVDFDSIACGVWRDRCESKKTRFVVDWDGVTDAESIAVHMRSRIVSSECAERISMCNRGDAVWDYMRERASDAFCDLWKSAASDFVRDKLCAASLVGSGFSSVLYPNADSLDWNVGGFNVLADVRAHQRILKAPRHELLWASESDISQALGMAIESGLALSSAKTGPFDYVSVNRHGLMVEHRAFDWVGSRYESESMSEHVVDVALAGLVDGSLIPFSGKVPDVVCEHVGRTFSYVMDSRHDMASRTPIVSDMEMCVGDDFELG